MAMLRQPGSPGKCLANAWLPGWGGITNAAIILANKQLSVMVALWLRYHHGSAVVIG
jgi:hypothetical protein